MWVDFVPSKHFRNSKFSCQYGIRFENPDQARAFMFQLSEEVARRLDNIEMRARSITLKIMIRDPSAPVEPPKVKLRAPGTNAI